MERTPQDPGVPSHLRGVTEEEIQNATRQYRLANPNDDRFDSELRPFIIQAILTYRFRFLN